jgi:hypothetical protein
MPRQKLKRRDIRSAKIFATFTPAEFAAVKAHAKATRLTMSSWLRVAAMRQIETAPSEKGAV